MPTNVHSTVTFKPVRNPFFPLTYVFLTFTVLLVLHFMNQLQIKSWVDILYIVIWVLATVYYLWTWTSGTYYQLQNGYLLYRSGFTKGKVPIKNIRKIETTSRAWGNIQAALTFRGLLITYNKWDEIFIAPQNQETFLQELVRQNPEIQIRQPQEN